MEELICLGIESTSHSFSVGIVNSSRKVLSNSKSMLVPKIGYGFIPNEMFDHHVRIAKDVFTKAIRKAGIAIDDVDCVSFSQGMGIPNSLRVGASIARYVSLKYCKPLVGVNHAIGHIEIGKLTTDAKDPVIVYLSGGNTQIIACAGEGYRIFGETMDISVGNAFDVVARALGLRMPGGPMIEKMAVGGKYIDLPYVVKGMDMSFTGIITEAVRKFRNGAPKRDVAHSLQETCFSMLTEVTERALAHTGKGDVLVVGGVAVNKRLQEMMMTMCDDREARFFVTGNKYSGDNGAMIAWAGLLAYESGHVTNVKHSGIRQKWRADEAGVN
jgi:universal protein Kae1